jgi:protein TonB
MSSAANFDYEEKRGFFQRFGLVLGLGGIAAVVVLLGAKMLSQKSPPARKQSEIVMIKTVATPPPPPPPPAPSTPQQQQKQEMMEQTQVDDQEMKPEPQEASAPAMGTNIQGSGGPDAFGLGANKGGGFLAGGSGKSGGSRFGWYAAQVQRTLSEALHNHPLTRDADFVIKVRIWADESGRIVRAKLAESTGNPKIDQALAGEILTGRQLQEPPPSGMPMPIVARFTLRRPN